jgi:hypothetical protein
MDQLLRRFLADVDALGPTPDPAALTAAVSALTLDRQYWAHQVAVADGKSISLHRPERGVQLALARRTDGRMSYVHSHHVWVALSAVEGVETHRRYDVAHVHDDVVDIRLAEERRLQGGEGDVVVLVPPLDVHSHGHVRGSGEWPYTLIVLGDDQLRYRREEYDLDKLRRRVLEPGDRGTGDLPEPVGED